jgi:hypothetical protein
MQPLIQGTLGQGTDVPVLQLPAHLSQTESQRTPAVDLAIHILPDALIWTQQTIEIHLHTATAHTPHTRQGDGQWPPPRQQLSFPESITTKAVTGFRPAATASSFSTQPVRYSLPSPVVRAAKNVEDNGHE